MPLSGTKDFLNFLLSKDFSPCDTQIKELKGKEVTEDYFIKNNFRKPILVRNKKGLRLVVPDSFFKVEDVCNYLGRDYQLDVIDVVQQDQFKMRFWDFLHYFREKEPRSRRLNVLSLEISQTRMAKVVEPPYVIKEMSLVEKLWRSEESDKPTNKPSVQKYCLMSMKDSWTDFHIDFGGSSVWYHVLWGHKVFYLIPPRKRYIKEFTQWMNENNNRLIFFPDLLNKFSSDGRSEVFKLEIHSGDTIMLPAGWIHAVHTIKDSMVFGGNFLHSLSIPTQLKIYKIEKILKTEDKFMFPYFEKLHWFVAEYILQKLERNLAHNVAPVKTILKGALKLLDILPEWKESYHNRTPDERLYNYPTRGDLLMSKTDLISRLSNVVQSLIENHISAKYSNNNPAGVVASISNHKIEQSFPCSSQVTTHHNPHSISLSQPIKTEDSTPNYKIVSSTITKRAANSPEVDSAATSNKQACYQ